MSIIISFYSKICAFYFIMLPAVYRISRAISSIDFWPQIANPISLCSETSFFRYPQFFTAANRIGTQSAVFPLKVREASTLFSDPVSPMIKKEPRPLLVCILFQCSVVSQGHQGHHLSL